MLLFRNSQIQISPCIASKARFALGLKDIMPLQQIQQKCTPNYWGRVIDTLCMRNQIDNEYIRQVAINRFDELINNQVL
jgi:hypothetical protein